MAGLATGWVLAACQKLNLCVVPVRHLNANRAVITKRKRSLYTKMYPALMVNPDGSTINISYNTPRKIIRMPVNFDSCDDETKKKIRLLRQPIGTAKVAENVTVAFDPMKYVQ